MLAMTGTEQRRLGKDGRLRLSPRHAKLLPSAVIASLHPEGCIAITSGAEHPGPVGARGLRIDLRGRMMIPAELRRAAGLSAGELCVVVGCGDCVEVWSTARYERMQRRGG